MGGSASAPSKQILDWQRSGKYYQYGKYRIFYKDEQSLSSQTGMTVVCLHGWPTCSYDYRKVWDALKSKFRRVIAIDYLGMGFSSKPRDYEYTFANHAQYIEELLTRIGVTDFHLLGRALSNVTCGELLRRYEIRQKQPVDGPVQNLHVKSVSFTNGMVFPDVFNPPATTSLLRGGCGPCCAEIFPFSIFKSQLRDPYGPKTKPTDQEISDYWYALCFEDGRQAQPQFLEFQQDFSANALAWVEVYRNTSVPLQDIHGPAGPVIPIEKFEPRWRQEFPNARLDILADHIGHFVQQEDPEGFIATYFSFIDSIHAGTWQTVYPSLEE